MATEETALIVKEKLNPSVIFTAEGMKGLLGFIDKKVRDFTPDTKTDAGRKEIASMAYKVARSKTLIDDVGKESISEFKTKVDNCNKYRKQARDHLDNLKEEVRKPLTDWEAEEERKKAEAKAKEKERVDAIRAQIQKIKDFAIIAIDMTSEAIGYRYENFLAESGFDAQEFDAEYQAAYKNSEDKIREALGKRRLYEEEQTAAKAEAERLEKIKQEQEDERQKLEDEKKKLADEKRNLRRKQLSETGYRDWLLFEFEDAVYDYPDNEWDEFIVETINEVQKAADREAKEKAEAEEEAKLREARKPEKERLLNWLDEVGTKLSEMGGPCITDSSLSEIYNEFNAEMANIIENAKVLVRNT